MEHVILIKKKDFRFNPKVSSTIEQLREQQYTKQKIVSRRVVQASVQLIAFNYFN